jgi:hypothetical protein
LLATSHSQNEVTIHFKALSQKSSERRKEKQENSRTIGIPVEIPTCMSAYIRNDVQQEAQAKNL